MDNSEAWRGLAEEFGKLRRAEEHAVTHRWEKELLHALHRGAKEWELYGFEDELFREEFQEMGTRAGKLLDPPPWLTPYVHWLFSLRRFLFLERSEALFPRGQADGIILSAVKGCQRFCLALARGVDPRIYANTPATFQIRAKGRFRFSNPNNSITFETEPNEIQTAPAWITKDKMFEWVTKDGTLEVFELPDAVASSAPSPLETTSAAQNAASAADAEMPSERSTKSVGTPAPSFDASTKKP